MDIFCYAQLVAAVSRFIDFIVFILIVFCRCRVCVPSSKFHDGLNFCCQQTRQSVIWRPTTGIRPRKKAKIDDKLGII